MSDMRLVVTGAGGRMGLMLIRTIAETDGVTLVGALERSGAADLGQDAGLRAGVGSLGVPITEDALEALVQADGLIDFTAPAATMDFAALAAQARIVHVIGTTGLGEDDLRRLALAGHHAPIVRSGNMSLGVTLLAALVRQAAAALGADWDVEILEMHHRMKVDAPSGTALLLGEAAASGRAVALENAAVHSRTGHTGARTPGAIGFAALRGGTVVGDHRVFLAGAGERIELAHVAEDRGIFARGAVKAALWAWGRKPGFYSMADVLGLDAAAS